MTLHEMAGDPLDEFMSHLQPSEWGNIHGVPGRDAAKKMDERNYPDAVFIHSHTGQMSMRSWNDDDSFSHRNVTPWAHTVQERPTPQGHQDPLPFEPSKATTPTDPDLHALRQANPHLNGYQFQAHAGIHSGSVTAFHPHKGLVGELAWASSDLVGAPYGAHEIDMVQVHPDHRGKGLAEGMYDMAKARGVDLVHSSNRSEEGEAFARRTGGPTLPREKGKDVARYRTTFGESTQFVRKG